MNNEGRNLLINRRLAQQIDDSNTFPMMMSYMLITSSIIAIIVGFSIGEPLTESMILTFFGVSLIPMLARGLKLIIDVL